VTRTSLGERALNCFVDIGASDGIKWNRLILCVHYWQVLDVFKIVDGNSRLYPTGPSISEIVPTIRTLVDGVESGRVVGLDNLPGPCPGEVG